MEPEPVPMLIGRGILPARGKMIIGGEPKTNKSFVAINLMLALAQQRNCFQAVYKSGQPVFPVFKKCRVLYIEMELGPHGLQERLKNILGDTPPEEIGLFIKTRDAAMRLDTPEGEELIKAEVAEVAPDVVVFDPLAKFHLQDENSAQEMGFVMRISDRLIQDYGCAVIFVHHLGKPNMESPRRGGDRLRGSSAIFADIDTLVELDRLSGETVKEPILKVSLEMRRGEPIEPLFFKRLKTGEVIWMGEDFCWGGSEREYNPAHKKGKMYAHA
jgi:regulatory protein RepA